MHIRRSRRTVPPPPLWLGLAALQTGVLAGLVALIYVMLDSIVWRESPWLFPNLLSSVFYPSRALSLRFSGATVAGLALHVFISGAVGLLFSLALARFLYQPRRCRLVALVLALLWYYAAFRFVWPHINPAVVVYQPFPAVLFGHVLFGFCMGFYPKFVRGLGSIGAREIRSPFL